jgi:hypothetical protein
MNLCAMVMMPIDQLNVVVVVFQDKQSFQSDSDRDYLNPMGSCQAGLTWAIVSNIDR